MSPKLKFYLVYFVIGIAQPLALLFPLAWTLKFLGGYNPLWFVLDDTRKKEDGTLSEDYRIYLKRFRWKWLGVLAWHTTRNRVWNFTELFKVKNGNPERGNQKIFVYKWIKDDLKDFNGNKVIQDGAWAAGAGLKYIGDPGDDPYQINSGDEISKKYSIIGEGEIYYYADNWKGWRKTSCKLKRIWWLFGAKRWVTSYRGMNANRYAFKQKYQKDKPKK